MSEEKKENKQRKSFTLKPINIAWLAQQSFNESTPEDKVSDSELVDRLIDEARQKSQSPSQSKKNAPEREVSLELVIA